jgi:hypothetical protein
MKLRCTRAARAIDETVISAPAEIRSAIALWTCRRRRAVSRRRARARGSSWRVAGSTGPVVWVIDRLLGHRADRCRSAV